MDRKLVFVCSPYSGNIKENTRIAAEICKVIYSKTTFLPVAPHLYFPQFLDDNVQADRDAGIKYGLELMDKCEAVIAVCDNRQVSAGMKIELEYAEKHNYPVVLFGDYIELSLYISCRVANLDHLIKNRIILNQGELVKRPPNSKNNFNREGFNDENI